MFEDDGDRIYQVVSNDEEQYSIWPADREIPAGWRATGPSGVKADCLAHIEEAWLDMRPLSLRRHLATGEAP
jgi:MbtH protein